MIATTNRTFLSPLIGQVIRDQSVKIIDINKTQAPLIDINKTWAPLLRHFSV